MSKMSYLIPYNNKDDNYLESFIKLSYFVLNLSNKLNYKLFLISLSFKTI